MANKPFTSPREKKIAAFLIALIFIYGIYQYGYISYKDKKSLLDKKIRLAEHRLQKEFKLVQKASHYEAQYKESLSLYGQEMSDEEVMAKILAEIETVANTIKIGLADLKPNRVKKIDLANRFSVSLVVEADITNIMLFVYTLQKAPYDFYVYEFQLRKKAAQMDDLRCEMTLSRILIP